MNTAAALLAICAAAQAAAFDHRALPDAKAEPARVTRFERPPMIDGKLEEPEWRETTALSDFVQTQPGDNIPASYPTEARFGYDDRFLYIGIHAWDDPREVRATLCKRDDLSGNDYVAVWLDTFNDQRRAYVLLFNPIGMQADAFFTEGQTFDFSFDLVMHSKGSLTTDGYTIEAAVPFASLRFEAGREKGWGVHVLRLIRHLDEWDSWMPLRRESRDFATSTFIRFMEQAGHITGFENMGGERLLELIPTLALSETGRRVRALTSAGFLANPTPADPGRFVNDPLKADPGLTAKITITPGVTLDATINPDFGEVEADQLVVTANQRFPIFFEERRPFFLEGADIFQTQLQVVHTRTIIDPDFAMKLAGKRGRNGFGVLLATDNAPGDFSEDERNDPQLRPGIERLIDKNSYIGVLRFRRDVGRESNIGFLATSYDFIERHNRTLGFDGRLKLNPQLFLSLQLIGTSSREFFYEPERDEDTYRTGNGLGYFLQLQRTAKHLNLTLKGAGRTHDYRAEVGFTARTDTNAWDLIARYNSEPKPAAAMLSWSLESATRAQFDWLGRMQYSFQAFRPTFNFRRQTYLKVDLYNDYARVFEEEFGPKRSATQQGAFFGPPERSTVWKGLTIEFGTTPSKKYSAVVWLDWSWKAFDYDLGAGPRFPRVSPAALLDPDAPLDPGPGDTQDISAFLNWQPTDALRCTLRYTRTRLKRSDTRLVAYDQHLPSIRVTYQFTRFTFLRTRIDYDSVSSNVRGQLLFGWVPNPGTSIYAGYSDDLNYNGYNPFDQRYESGWRRNGRVFFLKMSWLLRRGL